MSRSQIIIGVVLLLAIIAVAAVKLRDSGSPSARPTSSGGLQIRVP